MKHRPWCLLSALVVVSMISPSVAVATRGGPESIVIGAARIVTRQGVTCGFVPTKIGPRFADWRSGTRLGTKRFVTHESEARFYKEQGKRGKDRFLRARQDAIRGSKICDRLSPFRFKRNGVIAYALGEVQSVKKKAVSALSSSPMPLGGLFAIAPTGDAAAAIDLVGPVEVPENATIIEGTYTSPDGSIFTHYSKHPDRCYLGRVPVGGVVEDCAVNADDLPAGYVIGDAGGSGVSESAEVVQWDRLGTLYFNIMGVSPACQLPGGGGRLGEGLARIGVEGRVDVVGNTSCVSRVLTWATLRDGGVIYVGDDGVTPEGDYLSLSPNRSLRIWKNGVERVLLENVGVSENGIQTMSDGRVFINLDNNSTLPSPEGPIRATEQSGILVYDESKGSLTTWYHLAKYRPVYSDETFTAPLCNCVGLLKDPIARSADAVYGIGSITKVVTPGSASLRPETVTDSYLWKLYPEVALKYLLPRSKDVYASALLAVSPNYAVVATPNWTTCLTDLRQTPEQRAGITGPLDRGCSDPKVLVVDLSTSEVTTLTDSSGGIATFTLESSSGSDTFVAQGVRLTDNKYVTGVIDARTRAVTWADATTIKYRWISLLN